MSQLSEEVLKVSVQYLGPAARNFLERQTQAHLKGLAFNDLKKTDLPELARWVSTSASLIIDKKKAEELADKIRKMG